MNMHDRSLPATTAKLYSCSQYVYVTFGKHRSENPFTTVVDNSEPEPALMAHLPCTLILAC